MSYNFTVAWRYKGPRYRLEGDRCPQCGTVAFPPRPLCPVCRGSTTLYPLTMPLEMEIFDGAVRESRCVLPAEVEVR